MIEILDIPEENVIGFEINGKVEAEDVERVFAALEKEINGGERLRFYMEVRNFHVTDISMEAIKEEVKFWLKHLTLIPQIEKAVLVTDSPWLKAAFEIERALISTLAGKSFSFEEKDEALKWLRANERERSRVDLTAAELVQTAALKAAGGFALGLLAADIFSQKQRKNIGWSIMLGVFVAGLPLGVKVLNNNRKLLTA